MRRGVSPFLTQLKLQLVCLERIATIRDSWYTLPVVPVWPILSKSQACATSPGRAVGYGDGTCLFCGWAAGFQLEVSLSPLSQ